MILGWPPSGKYKDEIYSNGGIVWQADLNTTLEEWGVLYESQEAAKQAQVDDLGGSEFALGSIRFLKKGGYVVHPSFIPGVFQLSSSGSVKRAWRPEDLWGEATRWGGGGLEPKNFKAFLAAGNTIDQVLALPEGPAVVVRVPHGASAHYRLGVLGAETRWYDIPDLKVSSLGQLRGDADAGGRIVLAGVARSAHPSAQVAASEIVVLSLPE